MIPETPSLNSIQSRYHCLHSHIGMPDSQSMAAAAASAALKNPAGVLDGLFSEVIAVQSCNHQKFQVPKMQVLNLIRLF